MKNLTKLNIINTQEFDVIGRPVLLARTKTNRYYLADARTGNLLTNGFPSETIALDKLAKIEDRRARGNMMGFRFGSKIDEGTVEAYAAEVWGDLVNLIDVEFDGHYWWTRVEATETGKVSEVVRADYVINYLRIPEGLETEALIAVAVENGARWDD